MATICGAKCEGCGFAANCRGCEATCGRPFGGECVAAEYIKARGTEEYAEFKKCLLNEINSLLEACGIPQAKALYELPGFFVNLPYPLPNGETAKFLDDKKIYLGAQIETEGEEKCYGIVAGTDFIIVSRYGDNGSEPELVIYKKR